MKQSNRNTPIVFCVAMVLLCAVLFSSHLTGGLYARYTTSATANDEARVARFDVTVTEITDAGINPEGSDLTINYFENKNEATYSITIASNSEVAVSYDVILTFDRLLPAWLVLKVGGNIASDTDIDEDRYIYTFEDVVQFAPGSSSQNVALTFTLDTAQLTGLDADSNFTINDILLDVRAEQID